MRVLFASTPGFGEHLLPFADAVRRGGHDVLMPVLDEPEPVELNAVWSRVPPRSVAGWEIAQVRDVHAQLEADIVLPGVLAAIDDFDPDVVVRDARCFGAAIAAELSGLPQVRVATGLMLSEHRALDIAADVIDELRRAVGLPADPGASILRASPFFTLMPASFEGSDLTSRQRVTRRFHDPVPASDTGAPLVTNGDTLPLLGALAAGRPVVAVPLTAEQHDNARRLVASGAGLSVPNDADAIAAAVAGAASCRAAAERVARETRSLPSLDQVVNVLPRRSATRVRTG
jgi:UDP:flavonoid glycosyltransferase YjiC (YdhE family)